MSPSTWQGGGPHGFSPWVNKIRPLVRTGSLTKPADRRPTFDNRPGLHDLAASPPLFIACIAEIKFIDTNVRTDMHHRYKSAETIIPGQIEGFLAG